MPKGSGESKPTRVTQRPFDDGPPLTLEEIQVAPVIWAKLSGYSWWPARVATAEEVKGVKRPHGKDMICTYFLGDNNIGFVKLSNVLRFTHANCEQYGSRIATKSFKDGVAAAVARLNESDRWEKELKAREQEAANGSAGPGGALGAAGGVGGANQSFLDDGACEMCGDTNNSEAKGDILLCDSCDAEYHLACCTPPLKVTPEGEWFCLTCRANRGEPVAARFNEERAKKEATAKERKWLGKPPLPNKAGKKRSEGALAGVGRIDAGVASFSSADPPSADPPAVEQQSQSKKARLNSNPVIEPPGEEDGGSPPYSDGTMSPIDVTGGGPDSPGSVLSSPGQTGIAALASAGIGAGASGGVSSFARSLVSPPTVAAPASTSTSAADVNIVTRRGRSVISASANNPPPRGGMAGGNGNPGGGNSVSVSGDSNGSSSGSNGRSSGVGVGGNGSGSVDSGGNNDGGTSGANTTDATAGISSNANAGATSATGASTSPSASAGCGVAASASAGHAGGGGTSGGKAGRSSSRPVAKPSTRLRNQTHKAAALSASSNTGGGCRNGGNGGGGGNGHAGGSSGKGRSVAAAAAAHGGSNGGGADGVQQHNQQQKHQQKHHQQHHQQSHHQQSHHQQHPHHLPTRPKRPRGGGGDTDGGAGKALGSVGGSGVKTGRAPPPPPAPIPPSYPNASHALAMLGIPVSLPGGGRGAVPQQLHLQQTVRQLQATQHLVSHRASGGSGSASTSTVAVGSKRPLVGASDEATGGLPPCFMCEDDTTYWGLNAGNGEAIKCARDGCERVFHITCVAHLLQDAAARTPGGSGAAAGTWECPIHRCARCGEDENGLQLGDSSSRVASWEKGSSKSRRLWQCTWCSVAFCMAHLPPQLATAGRKARVADANQCVHCRSPSPRVKLAILLEGLCSRLANHHLAIPFLRPFLPGIASPLEKEELPAAPGKVGKGGAVPETPASETLPGGADESEDDPVGFDAEPAPANMRHRGEGGGAVCFQGGGVQAVTGVTSPPSNLAVSAGGDHGEAQRAVGGEGGRTRKRSLPSTAASKAGASRVTKAVPPPSPPGAAVGPVGDIMGLLDKTRALGYSRSAELMADVRILQGKCRKAVTEWGGGDPATGGGFGSGSGRMLVRAMDTLAATLEGLLARSREELTALEADIAKKSEREHRMLTDRGVGDGAADGGFPWRGECLPPADRPLPEEEQETANGGGGSRRSTSSRRPNTRGKGEALRLTRRWSLSSWSVYLQNAPLLRRTSGQLVAGETIKVKGREVLGPQQLRESLAEGMRSPAILPNPDDSEDSDGYYFSESDGEVGVAAYSEGDTMPVPEWSELETAVQALVSMDGEVDPREDVWDSSEPARLVQMESVIEEQRRLMRRMLKHNGNLRTLWRKYAAAPLEDRGSQGSEGVVTLGETSVLTEFQISNDLLRRRVQDLEEQLRAQSEGTEGASPTPIVVGNGTRARAHPTPAHAEERSSRSSVNTVGKSGVWGGARGARLPEQSRENGTFSPIITVTSAPLPSSSPAIGTMETSGSTLSSVGSERDDGPSIDVGEVGSRGHPLPVAVAATASGTVSQQQPSGTAVRALGGTLGRGSSSQVPSAARSGETFSMLSVTPRAAVRVGAAKRRTVAPASAAVPAAAVTNATPKASAVLQTLTPGGAVASNLLPVPAATTMLTVDDIPAKGGLARVVAVRGSAVTASEERSMMTNTTPGETGKARSGVGIADPRSVAKTEAMTARGGAAAGRPGHESGRHGGAGLGESERAHVGAPVSSMDVDEEGSGENDDDDAGVLL